MQYKVLSIDAWADTEPNSWTWNNWFNAGSVTIPNLDNDLAVLGAMVDAGYITQVKGADIEDDQYNLVIVDKETREPLFAIEYGSCL